MRLADYGLKLKVHKTLPWWLLGLSTFAISLVLFQFLTGDNVDPAAIASLRHHVSSNQVVSREEFVSQCRKE